MKVLLVVDALNDFCPGGSLPVPEGDQVMPVINRLAACTLPMTGGIHEYDLVVALKEQHPANHVSFASNHPGKKVFEQIEVNGAPQTLWPDHCVAGTPGADFHPALRQELIDIVVLKGTAADVDSYSGFFDNDHRRSTQLQHLIESKVDRRQQTSADIEVTVCGLALDYCVKATALDSVKLGYQTSVVLDACRAVNLSPGDDVKAMRELLAAGVVLLESRTILHDQPVQLQKHPEIPMSL